jgi:hypothetical protein
MYLLQGCQYMLRVVHAHAYRYVHGETSGKNSDSPHRRVYSSQRVPMHPFAEQFFLELFRIFHCHSQMKGQNNAYRH